MIKNLREELNKALGGAEEKLLIGRKKKEAFLAHADRVLELSTEFGKRLFDPNMAPRDYLNYDLYTKYPSATTVNCIFEKLFRSKKMMCTSPGLTEATIRKLHMEDFMRSYFRENNLIWWETWMDKYFKYLEV